MGIQFHDLPNDERIRILRNERRGLESEIQVLEARQTAGRDVNQDDLDDKVRRHEALSKDINKLEGN